MPIPRGELDQPVGVTVVWYYVSEYGNRGPCLCVYLSGSVCVAVWKEGMGEMRSCSATWSMFVTGKVKGAYFFKCYFVDMLFEKGDNYLSSC